MFVFKDKTIDEFRQELLPFVGKEIVNQSGQKVIIEDVSQCQDITMEAMTGIYEYLPNGEFDWDKATYQYVVYGFYVSTYVEDKEHGFRITWKECIAVSIERKNKKGCIVTSNDRSILSDTL